MPTVLLKEECDFETFKDPILFKVQSSTFESPIVPSWEGQGLLANSDENRMSVTVPWVGTKRSVIEQKAMNLSKIIGLNKARLVSLNLKDEAILLQSR